MRKTLFVLISIAIFFTFIPTAGAAEVLNIKNYEIIHENIKLSDYQIYVINTLIASDKTGEDIVKVYIFLSKNNILNIIISDLGNNNYQSAKAVSDPNLSIPAMIDDLLDQKYKSDRINEVMDPVYNAFSTSGHDDHITLYMKDKADVEAPYLCAFVINDAWEIAVRDNNGWRFSFHIRLIDGNFERTENDFNKVLIYIRLNFEKVEKNN